MIRKSLAAALFAFFPVAACAQSTTTLKWLEGQNSGIVLRRTAVVVDSDTWKKVWKEHDADAPAPAVDFAQDSVVVVFLGETKSAGVKIEIVVQKDMIDSKRLNVFYKEVRPAAKSFAASRICHPFAMVKVPKADVVSIEADSGVSIPEKAKTPTSPRDDSKVRALLESRPSFDGR